MKRTWRWARAVALVLGLVGVVVATTAAKPVTKRRKLTLTKNLHLQHFWLPEKTVLGLVQTSNQKDDPRWALEDFTLPAGHKLFELFSGNIRMSTCLHLERDGSPSYCGQESQHEVTGKLKAKTEVAHMVLAPGSVTIQVQHEKLLGATGLLAEKQKFIGQMEFPKATLLSWTIRTIHYANLPTPWPLDGLTWKGRVEFNGFHVSRGTLGKPATLPSGKAAAGTIVERSWDGTYRAVKKK